MMTARRVAWPTPTAPCVAVSPSLHETVAMMMP